MIHIALELVDGKKCKKMTDCMSENFENRLPPEIEEGNIEYKVIL